MQQVVRLLGDLGERYGAEHAFYNLRSPADAIKLLCINYPAFQSELITAHEKGIGYRVLQAGVDLDLNELLLPIGQNDLIVTPVLVGQGGAGKIFAGIGLLAVSFLLPGACIFGTSSIFGTLAEGSTTAIPLIGATGVAGGALATAIGTSISVLGASMVLGGVTQMLSLEPGFAAGLVIMCCCPGGAMSNILCWLVQADVTLSVAMTAASSLVACGMLPLNLLIYVERTNLAPSADLDFLNIALTAMIVVAGTACGLLIARCGRFACLEHTAPRALSSRLASAAPLGSRWRCAAATRGGRTRASSPLAGRATRACSPQRKCVREPDRDDGSARPHFRG